MKSPKKTKSESKTVLLIDDERDWLSSMSEALRKEPYRLVIADSGESALKKLKEIKPDLILSDVRMPVMNGFDLYERVRRDPKLKLIPYVFMSSIDDYDAIHVAKELGADDYVTKPFDDEDAKNIVSNLLTRFSK
ncbi:MAG: response regulator [Bacteroidota bacterium]